MLSSSFPVFESDTLRRVFEIIHYHKSYSMSACYLLWFNNKDYPFMIQWYNAISKNQKNDLHLCVCACVCETSPVFSFSLP